MIEALTLFPAPHVPAVPLRPDQQHVLDALTLGPGTSYEVANRLAQQGIVRKENCVGKRLGELEALGKAQRTGEKRPGSSSRKQHEWRLA